jgi:hypothetical protein
MKPLKLAGKKFGRLKVIKRLPNKNGRTMWKCICDCGKTCEVAGKPLKGKHTKSCGCLRKEHRIVHGHSRRSGHSRTYRAWAKMLERCENPKNKDYKYYGAKGITVHPPWHTFQTFLRYMGPCPDTLELDRIDPDKSYKPKNVRWANEYTQAINRNWTLWVDIGGTKMPMKLAAEKLKISYSALKKMTCKKGGMAAQKAIEKLLEAHQ